MAVAVKVKRFAIAGSILSLFISASTCVGVFTWWISTNTIADYRLNTLWNKDQNGVEYTPQDKTDLATLKTDVATLKTDVAVIKNDTARIKSYLKSNQ